jgi:ERF superfamily
MATKQLDLEPIAAQLPVRQATPMDLMQMALDRGQVDQLQILQDMYFKELARTAEVEFNLAMNAVQSEITRVIPDAYNKQTQSKWATYAALDKMLRPLYTKKGFSLSFDSGDSPAETVIARCYVSHSAGHTRNYQSPPVPLPVTGAQGKAVMTSTHGTGAAMSYAKRYLLAYIFNIPVGEDDTDGNAPNGHFDDIAERLEWIGNCSTMAELHKTFYAAVKLAKEADDYEAIRRLTAAKDAKKKELE